MGPRKLKCLLVVKAVDSLYSEFRAMDNLVARNTARVLKAYQNARVGYHHFGGSTGYGHEETRGREALDKAFAEIFGAESAIVRSQVLMQSLVLCLPSKGQGMSKLSIDFPFTTFLIESYLLYLCKAFSSASQLL